MARIKVISFDLDGTLFKKSFVDSVWHQEMPRLYSFKKNVSLDHARKAAKIEYDKIGKERLEWYDLHYWIRRFNLNIDGEEILRKFEHKIDTYPEVPKVLRELKERGFRLVIVTNASRMFVELELEKAEVKKKFERVFSSTSDFGMVKNSVALYKRVCNILEVSPQEMIHIDDDRDFDFEAPRKLGITAFFLDRTRKHKGNFVIYNLNDVTNKLEEFGRLNKR